MDKKQIELIKKEANLIRKDIVEEVFCASSGHPGGALSIADILAYLYFHEMRIDPKNPQWEDRDRFVLSKGHTCPALYATLAERGFFDTSLLKTFRQADSILQGHPDMKHIPGVDMSAGSLGLGISTACGMALSAKVQNKDYRVYSIIGDGESEEGQVWEAAMFAAHYKLDNLTLFLDYNGLQIDGPIEEIVDPAPFDKKFEAFKWNVITIDGHDIEQIDKAVQQAKSCKGKPTVIIAKTVKGKGVSFMENKVGWHGKAPNEDEYKQAIADLSANEN